MTMLGLFGVADSFLGFAHFLIYIVGGFFEILFVVLVLNMTFSVLKSIALHLGGIRKW